MKTSRKVLYARGRIVTMDSDGSIADAVLVAGERIEAVGTEMELIGRYGEPAHRIDLGGKTLYPGFIDSHSHLSLCAVWRDHVYCGDVKDLDEALARLRVHAAAHPEQGFVVGYGFDDTDIAEQRGPTRQELDAVCSTKPVLLLHLSVHGAYANTAMLKLLRIDPTRPCEERDVRTTNGLPTGGLVRDMVIRALEHVPPQTPEQFEAGLLDAVEKYNAQGFTSTIGGGVGVSGQTPLDIIRGLLALEGGNRLNICVYMPYFWTCYPQMEALGLLDLAGTKHVRPAGLKMVVDGSIQLFTAAVPEGYHTRPSVRPSIIGTQEALNEKVYAVHAAGRQLIIHGNGNGAIEAIIRAVELAQRRCPRPDPRHILVHCQMASDEQLGRMKRAGIWPTFFGLHIWNWGDRHVELFLGPERAARLDPCGSAARIGLPFSLHADTPILPQMTMRSIHTAVNRETKSGRRLGLEQRVSPLEAMKAYTVYPARMMFGERERGSIEPGKFADFTLLTDDPCLVAPDQIKNISIIATISMGRIVWGRI